MKCPHSAAAARWHVCWLAALALSLPGGAAWGQATEKLEVPETPQDVDFSEENSSRRVAFLDDGMAWEVPVRFFMLRHGTVSVRAKLPEPGRFDVALANPEALVEVRDVTTQDRQGRANVVALVAPLGMKGAGDQARAAIDQLAAQFQPQIQDELKNMSAEDLGAYLKQNGKPVPTKPDELRMAYVRMRTTELLAPAVVEPLTAMSKVRSRWVTEKEIKAWSKSGPEEIVIHYHELLQFQVADEYLRRFRLEFDSNTRSFRDLLDNKLEAARLFVSGAVAEDEGHAKFVARVLDPEDYARLRDALTVELACRFFPDVDQEDPNAQWFAGQRVACRARGAAVVRVRGRLDPGAHDRIDWWELTGYDTSKVTLAIPRDAPAVIEQPYVDKSGARLRVVAQEEGAVEYSFEFRASGESGGRTLEVGESPAVAGETFPF